MSNEKIFRLVVAAFLSAILAVQLCILWRLPAKQITWRHVHEAKTADARRAVLKELPVVRVEGTVDARVDNTVDVDVQNVLDQPLQVEIAR